MWHFNQALWVIVGLYSRNKEFFHRGHRHRVHRNACLTYLFIAVYSLVVWAGRHEDISKHKLRPAKSWVVRLISKRRQCSAEAKDPILVITLPPSRPPPKTPDAHAVSGSLNIGSWELVSLLCLTAFLYAGCVLTDQSATLATCGYFLIFFFSFQYILSVPSPHTLVGKLICLSTAVGVYSSANIPLWFSASGPVHRGGFPCQINITRVIHWHHRLSQLGPGNVPTITLSLWYS